MAMTVKRRKDSATRPIFVHKIADVRGGVSVATSDLAGNYLAEGAPLYYTGGKWHALKYARVIEKSTTTAVKVEKTHNLKTGDVLLASIGDNSSSGSVTKIDTSKSAYDTITLSAALGTLEAGTVLLEAGAVLFEAGTGQEQAAEATQALVEKNVTLKHTIDALNGTGSFFPPNSNVITDAWLIGVIKDPGFPEFALPKGITKYPF